MYPYVNVKENTPENQMRDASRLIIDLRGDWLVVPAPATLHVVLPNAIDGGRVLFDFLLVADTFDDFGVEGERTLWEKGGNENDCGADAELNTVETH